MSDWRFIMNLAIDAKKLMIQDIKAGEKEFEAMFSRFGNDGMIFFQRGQAYESLEKYKLAAQDYEKAHQLFPMKKWKEAASEGTKRVKKKMKKLNALLSKIFYRR
jgi:tetratricopeptide (TPR) repeat protein